jgi:hypothetical protein
MSEATERRLRKAVRELGEGLCDLWWHARCFHVDVPHPTRITRCRQWALPASSRCAVHTPSGQPDPGGLY